VKVVARSIDESFAFFGDKVNSPDVGESVLDRRVDDSTIHEANVRVNPFDLRINRDLTNVRTIAVAEIDLSLPAVVADKGDHASRDAWPLCHDFREVVSQAVDVLTKIRALVAALKENASIRLENDGIDPATCGLGVNAVAIRTLEANDFDSAAALKTKTLSKGRPS
jgi:hypothetical protein